MSTTYEFYDATIPTVVLVKNHRIVNSLIRRMEEAGVSSARDEHGFHFIVTNYEYGHVPEKKGDYSHVEGMVFLSLIRQLTKGNMLQLVHTDTFSTSGSSDYDDFEKVYEVKLKEAFYEGLFSHSL